MTGTSRKGIGYAAVLLCVVGFLAVDLALAMATAMLPRSPVTRTMIAAAVAREDRPSADRQLDAGRHPETMLEMLSLSPGDHVLDVLANPGYYTELISHLVGPHGQVVAYDPGQFVASPRAKANWTARLARLRNVKQLLQPLNDLSLPDGKFDAVLMHLAYHETYWTSERYGLSRMEPRDLARRVFRSLRPGGRLLVVDHVARAGSDPRSSVERFHRIVPEVIEQDMLSAGFVLDGRSDALRNPDDHHDLSVFDSRIRGRTDRAVRLFRKQVE